MLDILSQQPSIAQTSALVAGSYTTPRRAILHDAGQAAQHMLLRCLAVRLAWNYIFDFLCLYRLWDASRHLSVRRLAEPIQGRRLWVTASSAMPTRAPKKKTGRRVARKLDKSQASVSIQDV